MRPPIESNELFEMLRSFTALARTRDLSEAVNSLGIPRDVVAQHIDDLEKTKEVKLFDVEDSHYKLTIAGAQCAVEAESILDKMEHWLAGRHGHPDYVGGLAHAEHVDDDGVYYSQQHPLDRLWIDSPPLLRSGFSAWALSQFRVADPNMAEIIPYTLLYRKLEEGSWTCVSVGEKSSLATWVGSDMAKRQIGSIMQVVYPGGGRQILTSTYSDVLVSSSPRLDHVFARVLQSIDTTPVPVSYQRLICPCRYPNGEPVLMILVARTNRVQIASVSGQYIPPLPKHLLMEFDI